jgi:DNA-binding protein
MNKILLEFGFKIITNDNPFKPNNKICYKGYDKFFENIDINKIKNITFNILNIDKIKYKKDEILIVDRGKNERRSIKNIDILCHKFSNYVKIKRIFLDEIELKEQIIEFKKHKKIILQHGASMSNLIWCDKGTKIFEINPNPNYYYIYDKLINICGLYNKKIIQKNEHSDINVDKVINLVLNNKLFL